MSAILAVDRRWLSVDWRFIRGSAIRFPIVTISQGNNFTRNIFHRNITSYCVEFCQGRFSTTEVCYFQDYITVLTPINIKNCIWESMQLHHWLQPYKINPTRFTPFLHNSTTIHMIHTLEIFIPQDTVYAYFKFVIVQHPRMHEHKGATYMFQCNL